MKGKISTYHKFLSWGDLLEAMEISQINLPGIEEPPTQHQNEKEEHCSFFDVVLCIKKYSFRNHSNNSNKCATSVTDH